jgi:protein required for attachment to host cells
MKKGLQWVVVADASRASAYRRTGRGGALEPVAGFAFEQSLPRTSEILSDGPGRVYESAGGQRHSVSPPSDPHRELKRQFARRIAAELDRQLAAGAFESLVLVAPPAFLGDLRSEGTARLMAATTSGIAKDLTRLPAHAIAEHIEDLA